MGSSRTWPAFYSNKFGAAKFVIAVHGLPEGSSALLIVQAKVQRGLVKQSAVATTD